MTSWVGTIIISILEVEKLPGLESLIICQGPSQGVEEDHFTTWDFTLQN